MRPYWTCVVTRPHQERRAAHHVERQGFVYYHPVAWMPHRGQLRPRAMFPGYLFVHVHDGWPKLASTRGVSRLILNADDKPARITPAELHFLKSLEDDKGVIVLPIRYRVGDRVRFVAGKRYLLGMTGIVRGTTAKGRVDVLLRILGRHVVKTVEKSTLEHF